MSSLFGVPSGKDLSALFGELLATQHQIVELLRTIAAPEDPREPERAEHFVQFGTATPVPGRAVRMLISATLAGQYGLKGPSGLQALQFYLPASEAVVIDFGDQGPAVNGGQVIDVDTSNVSGAAYLGGVWVRSSG